MKSVNDKYLKSLLKRNEGIFISYQRQCFGSVEILFCICKDGPLPNFLDLKLIAIAYSF